MIVADAAAVLELLLGSERGALVEEALGADDATIHAPALLDAEVTQVLRRLVSGGVMDEARGRASLEILGDLPVRRVLLTPLLPRMWQLRENLTAYDAAYVALAEALGCPLVTFDARIAQAPGHGAEIRLPHRES